MDESACPVLQVAPFRQGHPRRAERVPAADAPRGSGQGEDEMLVNLHVVWVLGQINSRELYDLLVLIDRVRHRNPAPAAYQFEDAACVERELRVLRGFKLRTLEPVAERVLV